MVHERIRLTSLTHGVSKQHAYLILYEGPEGVRWELGFAHFLAGKMGFHGSGTGIHQQKTIENGNGTKI